MHQLWEIVDSHGHKKSSASDLAELVACGKMMLRSVRDLGDVKIVATLFHRWCVVGFVMSVKNLVVLS